MSSRARSLLPKIVPRPRLGVRAAARRAVFAARSRAGLYRRASDDGVPLPPPHLRNRVSGTPDADWFLKSGRLFVDTLASTLAERGAHLEGREAILDFGCGCGRVMRHLGHVEGDLHGTDVSRPLVRWCQRHLRFGTFATNALTPPLPYRSDAFDLVYAYSVFTHLPFELQRPWMDELARVCRRGGFVVITIHGERYADVMTPDEEARFAAGHLVVRNAERAGKNACAVFHPDAWIRGELAGDLEVLAHAPAVADDDPGQELYLLAKPRRSARAPG